MRTLGLLFCLVLLLIALPSILFGNLYHLAFGWQDAIFYLVFAALIYGILAAVAWSLNRKFNHAISDFLVQTSPDLEPRRGVLRVFGFLLVILLPYLIFLLLFSVFASVTFGLYGLKFLGELPRFPVGLLLGLLIVVLGTVYAFFVGMYRLLFPPRPETLGIEATVREQPDIWNLVKRVSTEVGTKPVDRILVTPSAGLSVHLEGALLSTIFGGGRRVLQIGIPSIHGLTVSELSAILAHEYGHFSNRDTQWSTFTYAMGNGLIAAFRSTPGPIAREAGESVGWVGMVMALNPAYWTLLLFLKLFSFATSTFSRVREVMADVRSMNLYGGEPFRNGLSKVAFNDTLFSRLLGSLLTPSADRESHIIPNFSAAIGLAKANLTEHEKQRIQDTVMAEEPSAYDSHPAIATRLKYSERFADGMSEPDKRDVAILFQGWDVLNTTVADLYNARLADFFQAVAAARAAEAREDNPLSINPDLANTSDHENDRLRTGIGGKCGRPADRIKHRLL